MIDRREFVFGSLAAAAAAACSSSAPRGEPAPKRIAPPKPKSILVLGGTGFLGPHVVEAALARGHTVTLFNRGKTRPGLFPTVEKLHGDRDGKLDALAARSWDAVVDPSGYVPRIVKASAELLAPRVPHYVFISTISVYKDHTKVGFDETSPVMTIDDPTNEDVKKNYGALKALSEQAAEAAMPGRVATIRPGLIVGPGDPTGRFSHWPTRCAEGGDVLAPGDGTTPVQWIDGRDLGAWIVRVIEDNTVGVYNALGPERRAPVREVLDAVNHAAGDKAKLVWVDAKFLDQHDVSGWSELPMWIDNSTPEWAGFGTQANARAIAKGLAFRPVADTTRDTLAWLASSEVATLPDDERSKARDSGIARDKERAVLAAWASRGTNAP